jgi:hypothetical protein
LERRRVVALACRVVVEAAVVVAIAAAIPVLEQRRERA